MIIQKESEGSGVEIFTLDGKYFIRYEAGELAPHMEDLEVTEAEALKAQKSWPDAYEVILSYQLRAEEVEKARGK